VCCPAGKPVEIVGSWNNIPAKMDVEETLVDCSLPYFLSP